MTVYIAGAVTNEPDYRALFEEAAREINERGHDAVLNCKEKSRAEPLNFGSDTTHTYKRRFGKLKEPLYCSVIITLVNVV